MPKDVRVYAIGDVHGRIDLLDQLLARVDENLATYPIARPVEIFLGDYVDRGPGSREVLERLIERGKTNQAVFLKGNHETFVTEFLKNPHTLDHWRHYGGLETLMSYGLAPSMNADPFAHSELAAKFKQVLPEHHHQFLKGLSLSFTCGDFFFVHAGIRPGVPLNQQHEDDLLWIREDFLLHEHDFEKIVVHGHTPVKNPDIRPNRINIDTGAFVSGRLTCLVLEHDKIYFI